jgi:hypothetical protein
LTLVGCNPTGLFLFLVKPVLESHLLCYLDDAFGLLGGIDSALAGQERDGTIHGAGVQVHQFLGCGQFSGGSRFPAAGRSINRDNERFLSHGAPMLPASLDKAKAEQS